MRSCQVKDWNVPVRTAIAALCLTLSLVGPPSWAGASSADALEPGLSINVAELRTRIDSLFSDASLESLVKQLPPTSEVWGYDVGDFSGDGKYDVAVTVRQPRSRSKQVMAYFFINRLDSFLLADTIRLPYYEIPIEAGFTIERGTCFVTTKLDNHHWMICGYRYSEGMFSMVDKYEVTRAAVDPARKFTVGHESYVNYRSFRSTENFFNPANGKSYWKTEFATIPAFPLNRSFPPDVSVWLNDTASVWQISDNLPDRALSGRVIPRPAEAPFKLSAWYGRGKNGGDNLYLDIGVDDTTRSADTLFFWFDRNGASRLTLNGGQKPVFRSNPDENVFRLALVPELDAKTPLRLRASFVSTPGEYRRLAFRELGAITRRNPRGYVVRLLVPAKLFDADTFPPTFGFTFELHRKISDSLSVSYASSKLEPWKPFTFGQIQLINHPMDLGYLRNVKLREIAALLRDLGLE